MDVPLCVICKGKNLCGRHCPIVERMRFWKATIESVGDNFAGTSPPSVFVGRYGYPKLNVGILSPPMQTVDAVKLDNPELWYQQRNTIRQIVDWRTEMILSRTQMNAKNMKGKLMDIVQELSMSHKPTDVEVWLKSKPRFQFSASSFRPPIGNPAQVKKAEITENIRIKRNIDYVVSDTDLKAGDAVVDLYNHNILVSKIEKIFSVGLLGLPFQRKLVPTRWSITGVDDIIGKEMVKKVKHHPIIPEFRVFHEEYIGNHYEIILIPDAYEYELVEIKHPKSVWNPYGKLAAIYSDYEPYWGRKTYAHMTGGAFYAARLAVMEYLEKIKRQATILIIRNVLPSYYVSMGIWQMRESIRGAFSKPPEYFHSIDEAMKRVSTRIQIPIENVLKRSKLFQKIKNQRKIKEYLWAS